MEKKQQKKQNFPKKPPPLRIKLCSVSCSLYFELHLIYTAQCRHGLHVGFLCGHHDILTVYYKSFLPF